MENNDFEKKCIRKFCGIEGQIGIIRTEQQHMEKDITEIKNEVKKLNGKVVKACVNNARLRGETGTWVWITRAGILAITGGLVTKLFALW